MNSVSFAAEGHNLINKDMKQCATLRKAEVTTYINMGILHCLLYSRIHFDTRKFIFMIEEIQHRYYIFPSISNAEKHKNICISFYVYPFYSYLFGLVFLNI